MLDLSWLRGEIARREDRETVRSDPWLQGAMRYEVKRRDLLKVGVAGSALTPAMSHASRRGLLFESMGDSLALLSGSGRRWTIDPAKFDGPASLKWSRTDHAISISLTQASLPGTGLRCDFTLSASLRRGSWSAVFAFPVWNASASVSLDEWLEGNASVLARVHLPRSDGGNPGLASKLQGAGTLRFGSDWQYLFEGAGIAQLLQGEQSAQCDAVTLSLPQDDARLLIKEPSARRTCAAFLGAGLDGLRPEVNGMSLPDASVPAVQVEYVRARDQRVLVASLWSADQIHTALNVQLDTVADSSIDVMVDSFRLAQLHDSDRSSSALFAGVRPGEQWIDVGGASVSIVAQANAVLDATQVAAQPESCKCEASNLEIERFVIPFLGADSAYFAKRNAKPKTGTQVEFKKSVSMFKGEVIVLDDFDLCVARTSDSFGATFRFKNIQLQGLRGQWRLMRKEGEDVGDSVLEFELASQHLNEESLFSGSPPGQSKLSGELLCGPFAGPESRFTAYFGFRAFEAWTSPVAADDKVRELLLLFVKRLLAEERTVKPTSPNLALLTSLEKEIEEAQQKKPIPRDFIPPPFLSKYLTQEWGFRLVQIANSQGLRNDIQKMADADSRLVPIKPAAWRPRAIGAEPTRLQFLAEFDAGAKVPCHLDTLMAWSREAGKPADKGLKFKERFSVRAVPADVSLSKQNDLKARTGERILGLHESVPVNALARIDTPAAVPDRATALALPYRLTVSPVAPIVVKDIEPRRFWQAAEPPSQIWDAPVALWHLRAGRSGGAPLPMRALYSPDFDKNNFFNPPRPYLGPPELRTSLDRHDRHNLVALSGGFGERALMGSESVVADAHTGTGMAGLGTFVPQPFFARQLVLTSMGASFDMLGTWDPPGTTNGALTVSKWDHRARIRRDTEVTVEYRGYLMPLGIPAVFIKRTTREFKRAGTNDKESYRTVLVQRYSIRVEQKVKEYPALHHPFESRDWCFRHVVVTPHETPPLLPPEGLTDSSIGGHGRQAFWPMVPSSAQQRSCSTGKLFEFTVEDGDRAFKAPLVFVDNQIAHTPTKLVEVIEAYRTEVVSRKWDLAQNRDSDFPVSKALARMVRGDLEFLPGAGSDNSRHVTKWFALGIQVAGQKVLGVEDDPSGDDVKNADLKFDNDRERLRQPPFYPRMSQALIESHLLAQLSGNAVERNNVSYHPIFVRDAFSETTNKGGVFVRFVQRAAPLIFGGNTASSGGAMSPTTMILALSREHGPIGGNGVYALKDPAPRPVIRMTAASNVKVVKPGDPDPVAQFIAGISDPVEYFAGALGNAKLLGCVRLVDIIKTVLHVTGTRVPRINQKEIFDGLIDLLRPVLMDVSNGPLAVLGKAEDILAGKDAPDAAKAKLLPTLRSTIGSLEQARRELAQPSPRVEVVTSLVGAAYSHLRSFVADLRQLTENPVALLPPAVQEVIGKAKNAYDTLVQVRSALEQFPSALRELFIDAVAEQTRALRAAIDEAVEAEKQALETQVKASPQYTAMAEWVDRIQGQAQALQQAIADNAWQRVGQALAALAEPVADLRGWVAVVKRDIESTLTIFADQLLGTQNEAAQAIQTALEPVLESIKPLEDSLKVAYAAAVETNKTQKAEKILEAMRSVHQYREMLIGFQDFSRSLPKPGAQQLERLAPVSEFLQKLDGSLRKIGEVASLCKQIQTLNIQSGLPAEDGLLRAMSTFVQGLNLSTRLEQVRLSVANIKVPDTYKDREDYQAYLQAAGAALGEAVKIAKRIEGGPADLHQLVVEEKQALLAQVEKQLSLMLAHIAPGAGNIFAAALAWKARIEGIEKSLDAKLDGAFKICGGATLDNLDGVLGGPISPELSKRLVSLKTALSDLSGSCKLPSLNNAQGKTPRNALKSIKLASAAADEVFALAAFVGQAVNGGNLGALVDLRALVEQALVSIGVPTKKRITYDWDTDIEDFPRGGGAVFRPDKAKGTGPGKQPRLAIHSVTEIDLRNPGTPVTQVNGSIDAFDLHLFGTAPFLIVRLAQVTFSSGTGRSMKFNVKVEEVKFGQALNFVNDLAKYIGAESGFYLQAATGVPGIEIGYRFNKDILQLAAVTLQNVSLSLAIILPFDNSPMRLKVGVGTKLKPVMASVGIYGGGFSVGMTMRADAMELLEASMEYGGVFALDIGGIAKGTCKITAGVYIALGVRDEIAGFFSAVGALTIASLMKVGASLVVTVSKAGKSLTGTAVYSFEFSIGFVEYEYSVAMSYTKDGDQNMDKGADGSESSGQSGSKRSAERFMYAAQTSALAADRLATAVPSRAPDYSVDMREGAGPAAALPRLHAGLADQTVWNAYWAAFSDLDGEVADICRT